MATVTITPEVAAVLSRPGVLERFVAPANRESVIDAAMAVLAESAYENLLASLAGVRSYLAA